MAALGDAEAVLPGWQDDLVAEPGLRGAALHCWLGGAGTVTQAHYDVLHNAFVQLEGTKRFLLWSPAADDAMRVWPDAHPCARKSRLPDVAGMPEPDAEVVLGPGEALYVPPFWFHHVVTEAGPSASLNVFAESSLKRAAAAAMATRPPPSAGEAGALLAAAWPGVGLGGTAAAFVEALLASRYADVSARLPARLAAAEGTTLQDPDDGGAREFAAALGEVRAAAGGGGGPGPSPADGVVAQTLRHCLELWAVTLCRSRDLDAVAGTLRVIGAAAL